MKRSFKLFKLFGIDIRIHATFLLLPLAIGAFRYMDYGWSIALKSVVLILLVFVCVLAHELSHSLVALRMGIRVSAITLYPIGGVASMQHIPKMASKEFLIAIVGPLSNFLLALLAFPILSLTIGQGHIFSPSLSTWQGTFANLFWANIALGAFNLIPAFPMDGGRVLRAFLAKFMGFRKATRISVYLGRVFAIIFFLYGLWTRHTMLVLVAIFIFLSANSEEKQLLYEESLERKLWHT